MFFAEPIVGGGFQLILTLLFSSDTDTLIGGFSFSDNKEKQTISHSFSKQACEWNTVYWQTAASVWQFQSKYAVRILVR